MPRQTGLTAEFTTSDEPRPVAGIRLATAAAGIRYADRDDVLLVELSPKTLSSAVFTRNRFCAAPVVVARENLSASTPRLLVFNSGNANAGTGQQGLSDVRDITGAFAAAANCAADQVLPFSTGVIGERLGSEKICAQIPSLLERLSESSWGDGAAAVMTTDTVPKTASVRVSVDGTNYQVTGFCKGSGMIHPDMATMLAFVATDAPITQDYLDTLLQDSVASTFNRITIDGDTSTNDSCVLSASAAVDGEPLTPAHPHAKAVAEGIRQVCESLAKAAVRDGEGATKFVEIVVEGINEKDALVVANTVALSPLVKTALFAGDPNWGRILAAVGRAPVDALDLEQVSIWLGDCQIVQHGEPCPDYDEQQAAAVMSHEDITIRIAVGPGPEKTRVWTCDFSYDYVRINAEYRS